MYSGIILVFGKVVRMLNSSLLCEARLHELFSMPHLILIVLKVTRSLSLGWRRSITRSIAIHDESIDLNRRSR
jgi:hypothetical protein